MLTLPVPSVQTQPPPLLGWAYPPAFHSSYEGSRTLRHGSPARSPICRSALSRLVRATFPDVAVISYLEIPANKATEIVATIGAERPRLALGPDAQMEDQPHEN